MKENKESLLSKIIVYIIRIFIGSYLIQTTWNIVLVSMFNILPITYLYSLLLCVTISYINKK